MKNANLTGFGLREKPHDKMVGAKLSQAHVLQKS